MRRRKIYCPIIYNILYLWQLTRLETSHMFFIFHFCYLPIPNLCHNLWVVGFFLDNFRSSLYYRAIDLFSLIWIADIFSQWDFYSLLLHSMLSNLSVFMAKCLSWLRRPLPLRSYTKYSSYFLLRFYVKVKIFNPSGIF